MAEETIEWVSFNKELAQKLLLFKDNRTPLVELVHKIFKETGLKEPKLEDPQEHFHDIDPFTFYGLFSKGLRIESRTKICQAIIDGLSMKSLAPQGFPGVPVVSTMNANFFEFEQARGEKDIDNIWELFANAIQYANDPDTLNKNNFIKYFDTCLKQKRIGQANLTMGLYWIRPEEYVSLDSANKNYLNNSKDIPQHISDILSRISNSKSLTGEQYLELRDAILDYINSGESPFSSIFQMSGLAYNFKFEPQQEPIENHTRYWLFSPGTQAGLWEKMYAKGYMAIGAAYLGDLRQYNSKEDIKQAIQTKHQSEQSFANDTLLSWQFANEMHPGDIVYAKNGLKKIIGRGVVKSEYRYDQTQEDSYVHIRDIEWTHRGEWPAPSNAPVKTLTEITDMTDYVNELEAQINESQTKNYWFITANPKIWSFQNIAPGETIEYELYNSDGNKRNVFKNFLTAKVGDLAFGYATTPLLKVVSIMEVAREQNGQNIVFKKVCDVENPVSFAELKSTPALANMEFFKNQMGTLFKLSAEEFSTIEKMAGGTHNTYTRDDFLSEVFMDSSQYDRIAGVLKAKKNIILLGAPGVGKTYAAKRLAYALMGEKEERRVQMIQFHQSYSYEDFIMGFRPCEDGNGFTLKTGAFYDFCKRAEANSGKDFYFIIDEINRGNLSKIFGELFMLIESDKRNQSLRLLYQDEDFSVPDNVYLIGLMNTADRSLAMLDYALRRRFAFIKMKPGFETEGFKNFEQELNSPTFSALIEQVKQINSDIEKDESLGEGFKIGHSFFCDIKPEEKDIEERLTNIVEYELIPLIEEYWFDESAKAADYSEKLRKALKQAE